MNNAKNKYIYIKNKHLKTILILQTLITPLANAADWSQISNQDGVAIYVDLDSYNEKDGLPYIDTKNVYQTAQSRTNQGKEFTYVKQIQTTQFNCTTHTYKVLKLQYFNPLGKRIDEEVTQGSYSQSKQNKFYVTLESLVCQVHRMVGGN